MRTLTPFVLMALFATIFTGCKKDKDEAPIVGLWKGKYSTSTSYPSNGYAFLFRSNGTVRVFDGTDTASANKAEGTYTISGSTINCTYVYTGGSQFSTSASIDTHYTFQEGSWGSGTNTTNGGKFFINKQ